MKRPTVHQRAPQTTAAINASIAITIIMRRRFPDRFAGGADTSCGAPRGGAPTVVDMVAIQFIPVGTIIPVDKIMSSGIFCVVNVRGAHERGKTASSPVGGRVCTRRRDTPENHRS